MTKKFYQPFFWGDYFRDTADLSLMEHGAYLKLIGTYWSTGRPIPADAVRMRRACGAVSDEEAAAAAFVLQTYFHRIGDAWRHHRIDRDLAEHAHRAEVASTAAKKAAAARWSPDGEAKGNAPRMRSASETQSERDANHSTPLYSIVKDTSVAVAPERVPTPSMGHCPPEVSMAFDQVFAVYPANRRDRRSALPTFVSMGLYGEVEAITAGIAALRASHEWQREHGRWIPSLSLFLERRGWEAAGPPAAATVTEAELDELFGKPKITKKVAGHDAQG